MATPWRFDSSLGHQQAIAAISEPPGQAVRHEPPARNRHTQAATEKPPSPGGFFILPPELTAALWSLASTSQPRARGAAKTPEAGRRSPDSLPDDTGERRVCLRASASRFAAQRPDETPRTRILGRQAPYVRENRRARATAAPSRAQDRRSRPVRGARPGLDGARSPRTTPGRSSSADSAGRSG